LGWAKTTQLPRARVEPRAPEQGWAGSAAAAVAGPPVVAAGAPEVAAAADTAVGRLPRT
jgi:hypothetical protein